MSNPAEKLALLRRELARLGLSGCAVPLTDEHMSEYVGDYAKRLEWLTGFTGSAGSAMVLGEKAAMFTDGRYTLQVRDQVDAGLYAYEPVPEVTHADWLKAQAGAGARIGHDPWYHTRSWTKAVREALAGISGELVATDPHPIDAIWHDRPMPSLAPILPHDDALAGETSSAKRAQLGAQLRKEKIDAAVISALDSVAWLFNIRGRDVMCTPVPRAYAMLFADGRAALFTESEKLNEAVLAHLGADVKTAPRTAFPAALAELRGKRVLVDPETTVAAVFDLLETAGATIVEARDPCILPKARKTPAEAAGTRAAHARDGAALTRFLHWIDSEAPGGQVDEMTADARLLAFRRESNLFREPSFPAITGAGANGAIVHYRTGPKTNRPLRTGELFLIDSGGQYDDGTTDVTRTIVVGSPSAEHKDRFTRVLKGHIALAMARFPKGTAGRNLDTLARLPLWQAGLDYDHGTGHGVGSFLAVHEGPQRIAKTSSDIALEPGMIVSNEPGYYKPGAYGIRIENLVLVRDDKQAGEERDMLAFETLTLAPIDRRLVETSLLEPAERTWLNDYHARVREALGPRLPEAARRWMIEATAAL
jgi:Xaa-Pro aminopeptidase